MNELRRTISIAAAILAMAFISPALAQAVMDHGKMGMASAQDMAEGEVRRVDTSAGKITIRHGEIKNLDMPPMTMVFTVAEPALLEKLKAGDKVRFEVEMQSGKMVITRISKAS